MVRIIILFFIFLKYISNQPYSRPKYHLKDINKNNKSINYNHNKILTKRQQQVLNNYFVLKVEVETNNSNYYYTTLYLGINKSPQTYILDTGSSIMTSPCSTCKKCGKHTNPYYKYDISKKALSSKSTKCSFLANNNKKRKGIYKSDTDYCTFNLSYTEGSSIAGFYNRQKVFFNNILNNKSIFSKGFNIPVGCTSEEKKIFYNQKADGIIGLSNKEKSFINMLYKTDTIRLNLFTLCFTKQGGYFALGRVDRTYHKSKAIRFVPILSRNYYDINVIQIHVGIKPIYYNSIAIIDTGNTISYFPKHLYDKLVSYFLIECKNKSCGNFVNLDKYGYCTNFETRKDLKDTLKNWPKITLLLNGYLYNWKSINYYYEFKAKNDTINACLGFYYDNFTTKITLGTNFIRGYDVIFDRYRQKIGFVRSDCSRTKITYSFSNKTYVYDFQRPKPIRINNNNSAVNPTNNEDDDELTILDEFDDGRKKKLIILNFFLVELLLSVSFVLLF